MEVEQNIDWHDFVVVEKIELYDDEEMKEQDLLTQQRLEHQQ
jgi:hypothetical protein